MNKRQAKKLALDIAIGLLYSEITNPSDFTMTVVEEAGYPDQDENKVRAELQTLQNQLIIKRQAFAD